MFRPWHIFKVGLLFVYVYSARIITEAVGFWLVTAFIIEENMKRVCLLFVYSLNNEYSLLISVILHLQWRSLQTRLISITLKTACIQHTAYSALYKTFNTYSQQYLQWGMSHFYELKVQQAARYRYISVVLGCPGGRRGDGCHPASRAVLHPPGAMHGQVERQDKVRLL